MEPPSSCAPSDDDGAEWTTDATITNRPNRELTVEEKHAKRSLTKVLKLQSRVRKLETRLSRSIERRDAALEERTREELQRLLIDSTDERRRHNIVLPLSKSAGYEGEPVARGLVESFYHQLRARTAELGKDDYTEEPERAADRGDDGVCGSTEDRQAGIKEHWHTHARELLLSMSKGTQTLHMFDHAAALVGYTRQKFIERAMLVVTSLGKLAALDREDANLDRLASVRRVASIGCGPGCDVVGFVSFLASLKATGARCSNGSANGNGNGAGVQLKQAIFLDWAMAQWRSILEPLQELLVPAHVEEVVMAACDIGYPLDDATHNGDARRVLETMTSVSDERLAEAQTLDLVIVSYLLSETRDRWHRLLDDIIPATQLVLLLDPTAWQLHKFRQRYQHHFAFTWLDSSMHHRDLQTLEGRVGPAVLLGVRTERLPF